MNELQEMQDVVETLKKETIQYKLFTTYFPEIPEEDIFYYNLILPTGFKDLLGDSLETYKWVRLSDDVDNITAIDTRLQGSLE